MQKDVNVPCLFYVTFNNRIVVYYELNMARIANMTLMETMDQEDGLQELLHHFNCDCKPRILGHYLFPWDITGNGNTTLPPT